MANSTEKSDSVPSVKGSGLGMFALLAALFGILLASIWFAARGWLSVQGPPMPESGYVAMTLGVAFSLLVGFALMALLFYSSRHGYDEPAKTRRVEDDRG